MHQHHLRSPIDYQNGLYYMGLEQSVQDSTRHDRKLTEEKAWDESPKKNFSPQKAIRQGSVGAGSESVASNEDLQESKRKRFLERNRLAGTSTRVLSFDGKTNASFQMSSKEEIVDARIRIKVFRNLSTKQGFAITDYPITR